MHRAWLFGLLASVWSFTLHAAQIKVGDKAPDFTLNSLDGQSVRLSGLTEAGSVVLVVLRGWPGYQCPLCTRQVQDYIAEASRFAAAKARVVMVYPGPAEGLKAHAAEFRQSKEWPKDFLYVTDPGFKMVNRYGLRWEAPGETAYPSTFVVDRGGIVRFARISRTHGERTKPADLDAVLSRLKSD